MARSAYKIALLPGDGIGPEVVGSAVEVLKQVADQHSFDLIFTTYDYSAASYAKTGKSITPVDMDRIGDSSDAILLGAMGILDIRLPDGREIAPQIDLRDHFSLFASLRHTQLFPGVPTRLKASNIDILVIRETTEGMFAGRSDSYDESKANIELSDRMTITRVTCEKLFRLSFEQARLRASKRKSSNSSDAYCRREAKVTLLHKSNVLRSNSLLVRTFYDICKEYPDVTAADAYIDAGAMYFITKPEDYDVVVTENLMGDIVSEVAAGIVGGLGVAPSADLSETKGVFQPCHGSAPDIAGKGVANPTATWLSAAMMLDWIGLQKRDNTLIDAAETLRTAIRELLAQGPKTRDIGGTAGTREVTVALLKLLANPPR